jgi:hypothetical protein
MKYFFAAIILLGVINHSLNAEDDNVLKVHASLDGSAQSSEDPNVPTHELVSISYTEAGYDVAASIVLTTSEWRVKCDSGQEITLDKWQPGDRISFLTKTNLPGIRLFNHRTSTYVYGNIKKESIKNFPTIEKMEKIPGGWFSNDQWFFTLSDRSRWAVWDVWKLSYRWEKGQHVLLSKGVVWNQMVNLSTPFEEGYVDDRMVLVNFSPENSP